MVALVVGVIGQRPLCRKAAHRHGAAAPAVLSSLLCVAVALFATIAHAVAKTPGETHCYKDVCHRVKTLSETRWWVGKTSKIKSTYYDDPSVDRYNIGKYTSSGEVFDADDPTRASSSNFPDGTELLVWNPQNGRAVHVRVNDFGPFHTDRKLDLTRAAAERIGLVEHGVSTFDVIVVAAPPPDEPRYKRGRRYPPALGYIGIFGKRQIDRLAERLVGSRKQDFDRVASIDIHQFLWTTKAGDLLADKSLRTFSLPRARPADEGGLSAETASPSAFARPVAEAAPIRLAALARGRMPAEPPLRRQRHVADAGMKHAALHRSPALVASHAPVGPTFEGVARFALRFAALEESGWRAPPKLAVSLFASTAEAATPARLAHSDWALSVGLPPQPFEVAMTDSDSIRWIVPGLDTFMRVMTPVWGPKVTPLEALEAAAAMAVVLLLSLWATLHFALTGREPQPMFARRRHPAAPFARPPVVAPLAAGKRGSGSGFGWHIPPPALPPRDEPIPLRVLGDASAAGPAGLDAPVPLRDRPLKIEPSPAPVPAPVPVPAPSSIPRARAAADLSEPDATRLAAGLYVNGTISSFGTLVVGGQVDGHCCCRRLVIEPGGSVRGTVDAVEVVVDGEFEGALGCTSLRIGPAGRVTGEIAYRSVSIASGADVDARLTFTPDGQDVSHVGPPVNPHVDPHAHPLADPHTGPLAGPGGAERRLGIEVMTIKRSTGRSSPSLQEMLRGPCRLAGA